MLVFEARVGWAPSRSPTQNCCGPPRRETKLSRDPTTIRLRSRAATPSSRSLPPRFRKCGEGSLRILGSWALLKSSARCPKIDPPGADEMVFDVKCRSCSRAPETDYKAISCPSLAQDSVPVPWVCNTWWLGLIDTTSRPPLNLCRACSVRRYCRIAARCVLLDRWSSFARCRGWRTIAAVASQGVLVGDPRNPGNHCKLQGHSGQPINTK